MAKKASLLDSHPRAALCTLGLLVFGGLGSCYYLFVLDDPAPEPRKTRAAAPPAEKELELPEEERRYLWDIEHHGNLLCKHGFGPLAAALKAGDEAALSRLLADDFKGSALGEAARVRVRAEYADVERVQDRGGAAEALTRGGFVARLLAMRALFPKSPPQVKLALMTLSPKKRKDLDGTWEGAAQLRLFGERAEGAPAEVVATLRYEVPRPSKDTLARPGWLLSSSIQQTATAAAAPRYLFADVARQRGLNVDGLHDNWNLSSGKGGKFTPHPGGVYVCDFDRDGILDMLVTDVNRHSLYRGLPTGNFEDVTDRLGLPRAHSAFAVAAWVDIDGDGWDDLILAGRIYRNEAGKGFVECTARCNLWLPDRAIAILPADYNRDGKLDLYVTQNAPPDKNSWLETKSDSSGGNRLYRNLGNWRFEDVTEASGTAGGLRSTFTAAWLDADNDGWPDLHVINEFGDGLLLVNNRNGTFTGRPLADRPADFGSMGVATGDVNNDGHIDIYCANMYSKAGTRVIGNLAPGAYSKDVLERMRRFVAGSQLHLNRGGLRFDQAGPAMQVAAVGWAYGPCLADLDNDGWLDVYATAGFVSRSRDEPDG